MTPLDTFWFIVFMALILLGMVILGQVAGLIKPKEDANSKDEY